MTLPFPAMLAKLDRFDCLVLDDLGYVRKDQAETTVLFELIAERYERRALITTCNQPFSAWDADLPRPRHDGRRDRPPGAPRHRSSSSTPRATVAAPLAPRQERQGLIVVRRR